MTGSRADKTVRVFVTGRVQGVFYRRFTKHTADLLGVHGWVRNLSDGRVEAMLQGAPPRVDRMLQLMKNGHLAARVIGMEKKEVRNREKFENFEIMR